jgi:hypothetical protein
MRGKGKRFTRNDIDPKSGHVLQLEAFNDLADAMVSWNARIVDVPPGLLAWTQKLDEFYWRAEDLYLLRRVGSKLHAYTVYHHAIHFLFVRRYGAKLPGRPLSMLLAETLASTTELNLILETYQQFGITGDLKRYLSSLMEYDEYYRSGRGKASHKKTLDLIDSCAEDPFGSFKEATHEMFDLFTYLFRVVKRRMRGSGVEFDDYAQKVQTLKYERIFRTYKLGLNMADAIAFAGDVSTIEDQEIIRDCFGILDQSESFIDFLSRMGVSTHHSREKVAGKTVRRAKEITV